MNDGLHIVCPHCHSVNRVPQDKLASGAKCGKCKQALFDGKPVELKQAFFRLHLNRNDIPVLVDFWAPWCGPCKIMAPIFAQAAAELQTQVRLAKVNTETEQALAADFGIRSIPTLALFRGGRELARIAGATDLQNLLAWTRQYL